MRRLKLMNEVLPAPTRASTDGPRDRTLRHMRRLLAFAATATATSGCGNGGRGYAVVDPLPAPPQCEGLAATLRATAVARSDGTVHVVLEAPTEKGASYVNKPPADAQNFTISEGRAELDVTPRGPGKSTSVVVQVDCARGRAGVQLTLDVPAGTLVEGTKLAVELIDYY